MGLTIAFNSLPTILSARQSLYIIQKDLVANSRISTHIIHAQYNKHNTSTKVPTILISFISNILKD